MEIAFADVLVFFVKFLGASGSRKTIGTPLKCDPTSENTPLEHKRLKITPMPCRMHECRLSDRNHSQTICTKEQD